MPENNENIIGGKICQKFLQDYPDIPKQAVRGLPADSQAAVESSKDCLKSLLEPPEERILISLHADSTAKEISQHAPDSPGSLGLVYELCPSDVYTLRGGFSGATKKPIWPSMYGKYKSDLIADERLAFVDVVLDARNYILKFLDKNKKECWVQVRPG